MNYFETLQKSKFKEKLKKSPDFQTMCYECVHFDLDLLVCTLIQKLGSPPTHIKLTNQIPRCLYWKSSNGFNLSKIEKHEVFIFN